MDPKHKRIISSLPGNSRCIDCSTPNPTWASVSHGTLHCCECIGRHRGLGVHISFARSLDLDSWDEKQLKFMGININNDHDDYVDNIGRGGISYSGNDQFREFFMKEQDRITSTGMFPSSSLLQYKFGKDNIKKIYQHPIAKYYRNILKARVEGTPEPHIDILHLYLKEDSEHKHAQTQQSSSTTCTSTKPTLSSHFMKLHPPSIQQCFIAGLKFNLYKNLQSPIQSNYITSTITLILYIASKITFPKTSTIHNLFHKGIVVYMSFIFINSIYAIYWIQHHRQTSFKSSYNFFIQRMNDGRIKRNMNSNESKSCSCDIYFPKNTSIGSKIDKGIIFYPESLVDITSYSIIMSKLSDSGILVVVMNMNPTLVVTPYHKQKTVNDCFKVIYQIEKLMGMIVNEWVLGGHGHGADYVLKLRYDIASIRSKANDKKRNEKSDTMKCVLWGLSSTSSLCYLKRTLSQSIDKTLFITASNDLIARSLRFSKTIARLIIGHENNNRIVNISHDNILCYSIEGGNHSGFAHYGPQTFPRKDGNCLVSIDRQQKECLTRTIDFIFHREPSSHYKLE